MKTKFIYLFIMILAVFTLPNIASACDYQLKMIDSYGDGWNGGKVTVFVNGTAVITDATIATGGGPEYVTFAANTGDLITTDYTAGSYPGENEYYILDATGAEIAAEGAGGTPGDITTAITAACPVNNDAGMIDILYLDVSGNQAVKAVIMNYGIVALTSATVNWTIDGGVQTPASWTGSIATGEIDTVVIGTVTISQGNHTIIASSDLPNGVSDENLSNDTNSRTSYFIGAHAFPLTEGFESGFDKFTNASGNDIDFIVETTLFHSGAQSVKNVTQDANNSNIMHELGLLDLSSTSYPALEFWHIAKTEGGWDRCYIEISTDGGQSYTTIDDSLYMGNTANYAAEGYFHEDSYTEWGTGSQTPDNTWWKKEKFDLTPFKNDSVRIRFRYTTDSGTERYGWLIDDISVNEQPVDEIEVVEIIGFYGGFNQGDYTVQAIVKNNGVVAQTSIPLNFMVEGGAVVSEVMPTLAAFTTDTFTFTAKAQSSATADTLLLTVYSTLSSDEDLSNDTAATDIANLALTYANDFEGENNILPQFWQSIVSSDDNGNVAIINNASYSNSGTKSFALFTNAATSGALIGSMPAVNSGLTSLRLEFMLKTAGPSELIVGVMTDPMDTSTFVGIDTFSNITSYAQVAVMFDNYAGSGKFISFKHSFAGTYDNFFIDDIKLFVPPANEIEVAEIIGTYGGFGQGNYTVQAIVKNNGSAAQSSIPLNFMVEGGSVVSEVMPTLAAFTTDTFTFTTKAQSSATADTLLLSVYSTLSNDEDNTNDTATYFGIINMDLPYIDDFESYSTNSTPQYWSILNLTENSSAYAKVAYSSSYAHSGYKYMHMYNSSVVDTTKPLIASFPITNFDVSSFRLEFWVSGVGSKLYIGVMSDPMDETTFTLIDSILPTTTSSTVFKAVMFDTYTGSGKYVAFKHGMTTSSDHLNIDDIKLYAPVANEVELISIISANTGGFGVATDDTVTVIVRNNGTANHTALNVKYQLDNNTAINETFALAAFTTDTFQFATTFDASASGKHTLTVYTDLSGDEDNTNDTVIKSFITYGDHAIPFTEDFEADYTYFENDDASSDMFNLTTTLKHSGNNSVHNQYSSNAINMLHETGAMDLTSSTTPVFDFWQIAKTEGGWDKCFIQISTDNGQNWVNLPDSLYRGSTSNYATKGYFHEDSYSEWGEGYETPDNSWWKMERFNLEAYKDDSVRIRFFLDSDGSAERDGWYIDDITVQEEPDAVADLGNDTTLCAGSSISFDVDMGVGYTYIWTTDNDTLANTASSLTTDSSGTYTVQINGIATVAYDTIVITDVALPTVATFTADEICTGDDATLAASFTGATPWSFSYTKDVNDTTDVTDVVSPWTSTFAVTDTAYFTIIGIKDANGCVSTIHSDTIAVNVNPLPVVAIASLSDVCANESVFTYTQGSGPAGGSGYYSGTAVDSASSTFNAVTAGAGSHTITYTYTDSNACVNSTSGIQIVNALPNITAAATDNPVPYNATTTLTASVSNAVGAISYAWTPSSNITETDTTTASLTTTNALSTVNYYVKVTDAGNTCTTWDTIVLPYSGGPVSVAPSSNPTAICSGDTATLSSGTSGGSGVVTYVWTSNPVGFNSTLENPSVSPTVDTWFIVAATDDVLTTKDSVLITIIADPAISYVVDTTFACFGSDAEAIVNITGLAPFSYTYNGIITNATNNTDTVLLNAGADATYKLSSVTDANGCTATSDFDSIVVSAWALPLAVASDDATICFGDSTEISIALTGMAPWTFDVFDGTNTMNVASATSPFTVFADPDSTVKYTIVSVTDGHSCNTTANMDSLTVFVNQLATATVSDNDTMCIGDSVQLAINFIGAAPYTFNVTDGTTPMSLSSTTDVFNKYVGPDATTTYTLTSITDDNGCTANNLTEATEVFVNPLPTAPTFTGLAADYCEDAAVVTLVGAPTGGLFSGSGITASDFDPSTAASGANDIEYRITDANGCENFVINSTTINTLPSITISGLASAYCVDAPAATLTATPTGTGGVWSGAVNASVEFEASVSGLGNHTVYYEFTDANGCVNNDSASTLVNALPVVAVTTLADVCFDEPNFMPIGATPVGGTWTGAGVMSNYFNAATAGAGSHYLTYTFTDANGCVNLDSTTQVVNALPVLTVTGLATAYCTNDDADTLVATPTGGTYYGTGLSGNVFTPANANVGSNSMLYMFTDANGCFNSYTATTMVNAIPTVNLASASTVCVNSSMTLDAGADGTSYIWNTGATTQTITADTNGYGVGTFTYSVDVTNADGCSNNGTTDITYEALPLSQLGDTSTICGENADITLEAGYVPGNTYVWSNGVSWSSITINSTDLGGTTGIMSVEITSDAGCVTNDQTYVYFREEPTIDLGGDQIVCVNHEFTIDAGAGFTSYLWNTGASTQSITIDSNTFDVGNNTISVEVYNDVNCNASDSMVLVVDPCTGVATPELDKVSISVYPNPTSGQFQIDVAGLENQEYNLDVYNSVGAVVFTDKVVYEGLDTKTWKLDFSSFAKGVYHIRLHSNGDIKVKRVVIQ